MKICCNNVAKWCRLKYTAVGKFERLCAKEKETLVKLKGHLDKETKPF